jgi:short/branched chain acyl-CoA dehydrogenase
VVDGAKAFITNSGTDITSVVTVTARTGTTTDGRPEISRDHDPLGHAGFTVEAPYDKLGWHISDTHGLTFEGCRVPGGEPPRQRGARLQAVPQDPRRRPHRDQRARPGLHPDARGGHGIRQDPHRLRAPDRRQPGRRLPDRRPRRHGRDRAVLTYKAAWLKDEQEAGRRSVAEVKQAAAVAKLYTSEAAVTATRIATQVFGGNGFMEEYPVARFYRDAKILEIGEGTSEVQRMVIARGLGLPQ